MDNRILLFCIVSLFVIIACTNNDSYVFNVDLPEKVDFNFHIKPILSDRCFSCHGPDAGARKANVRLDEETFAFMLLDTLEKNYVIKPGHLNKSEVYKRISTDDAEQKMPPPESNLSLSEYEIALHRPRRALSQLQLSLPARHVSGQTHGAHHPSARCGRE